MPTFLRQLPDGTRFILCRTGERFTLLCRDRSGWSGTRYVVQREDGSKSGLRHSCHVKPIIRA